MEENALEQPSSDLVTDQLVSGQLESSGDLVGEHARQSIDFSSPLENEESETEAAMASGNRVTSTLEPSSPENLEPVEHSETVEQLPDVARAEPETSDLSASVGP